ncbi:hypothetical protein RUM43_001401 [Polyplax serrata]|uniref:EF-hand domain-containing protein n=1 Tax=Polyplax serrata TaxID=468196 RepID=A0AAN8SJD6_POLSC
MSNVNCYEESGAVPENLCVLVGNSTSEFVEICPENNLTDEELEDMCRAFVLLDVDGDGVLEVPQLEQLLISLGRLPFDDNLARVLCYSGAQGSENAVGMNFTGFRTYLTKQLLGTTNYEELQKAFQVFDTKPPTGKVNVKQLRHVLKTVGAKLTDDEIDFLYKEEDYWMLDEKDTIDYDMLIDKLLNRPYNCKFLSG